VQVYHLAIAASSVRWAYLLVASLLNVAMKKASSRINKNNMGITLIEIEIY
jgi:hypothetical protein